MQGEGGARIRGEEFSLEHASQFLAKRCVENDLVQGLNSARHNHQGVATSSSIRQDEYKAFYNPSLKLRRH